MLVPHGLYALDYPFLGRGLMFLTLQTCLLVANLWGPTIYGPTTGLYSNYGCNVSPGASFHFYLSIVNPLLLAQVTSSLLAKAQNTEVRHILCDTTELPITETWPTCVRLLNSPFPSLTTNLTVLTLSKYRINFSASCIPLFKVEWRNLFLTRVGFTAGYQATIKQNKIKTIPLPRRSQGIGRENNSVEWGEHLGGTARFVSSFFFFSISCKECTEISKRGHPLFFSLIISNVSHRG